MPREHVDFSARRRCSCSRTSPALSMKAREIGSLDWSFLFLLPTPKRIEQGQRIEDGGERGGTRRGNISSAVCCAGGARRPNGSCSPSPTTKSKSNLLLLRSCDCGWSFDEARLKHLSGERCDPRSGPGAVYRIPLVRACRHSFNPFFGRVHLLSRAGGRGVPQSSVSMRSSAGRVGSIQRLGHDTPRSLGGR